MGLPVWFEMVRVGQTASAIVWIAVAAVGCREPSTPETTSSGTTGEQSGSGTTATADATSDGSSSDETSGGPTDPPPDGLFGSGTRLKAHYYDAGDGAVELIDWYDSALDMPCRFALDAAGSLRCMPYENATLLYTDAACTQPAVQHFGCGEVPSRVAEFLPRPCIDSFSSVSVLDVGERIEGQTLYITDSAQCVVAQKIPDAPVYEATPANPTDFAEADLVGYRIDERLGVGVAQTAGGAFERAQIQSLERGTPCFVQYGSGGNHCLPSGLSWDFGRYHPDMGCTEGGIAYGTQPAECGQPEVALVFTDVGTPACPSFEAELFTVDGPAPTAYDVAGTCTEAVEMEAYNFWRVGDPLPPDSAPLVSELRLGGGRVVATAYGNEAGELLTPLQGLLDTDRDVPCFRASTPQGWRCLPADAADITSGDSIVWGDPACQGQELLRWYRGCGQVPSVAYVVSQGEACDAPLSAARELGEPVRGPVYMQSGPDCVEYPAAPEESFYPLGPAIGFGDFPELIEVTDP